MPHLKIDRRRVLQRPKVCFSGIKRLKEMRFKKRTLLTIALKRNFEWLRRTSEVHRNRRKECCTSLRDYSMSAIECRRLKTECRRSETECRKMKIDVGGARQARDEVMRAR